MGRTVALIFYVGLTGVTLPVCHAAKEKITNDARSPSVVTRDGLLSAVDLHVTAVGDAIAPDRLGDKLFNQAFVAGATDEQIVAVRLLDGILTADHTQTPTGYKAIREHFLQIGASEEASETQRALRGVIQHYQNSPGRQTQLAERLYPLRNLFHQDMNTRKMASTLGRLFEGIEDHAEISFIFSEGAQAKAQEHMDKRAALAAKGSNARLTENKRFSGLRRGAGRTEALRRMEDLENEFRTRLADLGIRPPAYFMLDWSAAPGWGHIPPHHTYDQVLRLINWDKHSDEATRNRRQIAEHQFLTALDEHHITPPSPILFLWSKEQ